MFIGRKKELEYLKEFQKRKVAGLVVCSGRRRIGKSTLIEHFAEKKRFFEFYGLSPRESLSDNEQLKHFGDLMGTYFQTPPMKFDNWTEAFSTLAGLTREGPCVIFLDEISWMAGNDKDFAGRLKGVWDTKFKHNPELILILCGSVSSWIQENILKDKGFMGRVSLVLSLDEMPLSDANMFWQNRAISSYEKFKLLAITGGIPRYLEEIRSEETAEQNIKRMCFSKGAILLEEFDKIFQDIFERKSDDYKAIVHLLTYGSLEVTEIAKRLEVLPTGGLSAKLTTLMECGFLSRDYVWNGSKQSRMSKYRLKDNYLRFYLRYIDPKRALIEQGLLEDIYMGDLDEWYTIMGLQFENLVLNNLQEIVRLLQIPGQSILSAAPFFQRKTGRKEACQIDLLIQTKHTLYVCEIKFRKMILPTVIQEVESKIKKLKVPKTISIRPVLIYVGTLSPKIEKENFFSHCIPFETLLTVR